MMAPDTGWQSPDLMKNILAFLWRTLVQSRQRTPLKGIKGNLQLAQRRLERLKRNLEQQP
ncbi:hypothetical protein KSD_93050 [Ktedonobacter sp. SOSP1-85]|nr:hypothetical protein KSD_93050 [Ktedonobacter sp. SOSP1-85]